MSWLIFVIQTKWIVCACVRMSTLSFMFWRQIISMQEQQGVFTTHIKPIWNGLTITSMFNRCSISFYPQNLRKILKLLIQWLILCVAEGRFEFVMWVCSHYNQHIARAVFAFMYGSCTYDMYSYQCEDNFESWHHDFVYSSNFEQKYVIH